MHKWDWPTNNLLWLIFFQVSQSSNQEELKELSAIRKDGNAAAAAAAAAAGTVSIFWGPATTVTTLEDVIATFAPLFSTICSYRIDGR